MKFCSDCSEPLRHEVPDGDDRPRHVCAACGSIHYQNPKVIAGCLPIYQDQILLCRRAISPRRGFWTLPAGFMELGETLAEAAIREAWEEACVTVELDSAYTLMSLPALSQVHLFYRARMPRPEFRAGPESLEVALFHASEIPWDDLAFETVRRTIDYFLQDRGRGRFEFREEVIVLEGPLEPRSGGTQ